jgi:NAD+ synthase
MKNLANEIVAWLKDYAVKSNRKSWVVGISGGVDSALVSTLCAMTGIKTFVVSLPCQSKQTDTTRAASHIKWLTEKFPNVSWISISLTDVFNAFGEITSNLGLANDLAYANAKSRLRMIALYQVATIYSGLVVGTGNRVEDYGVFFYTKYGDGGIDIAPIADLMKSEVRQMCRELGVLPELCEAVPTDGLWQDNRTDESQLGATYEELEWALNFSEVLKTHGFKIEECSPRELEVLAIYDKWHKAGLHKILPIPTFRRK